MPATVPARPDGVLIKQNLKTTSLCIASRFGKRHDDVLKRIRTLEVPEDYHLRNFAELSRTITVNNGAQQNQPYYELTRDGFALLVMGFTGKRAMAWKIKFLDAFNAMEAALRKDATPGLDHIAAHMEQLSPEALEGFLRLVREGDTPSNHAFRQLIDHLGVILLDRGMTSDRYEAIRHIRSLAASLAKKETLPPYLEIEL